MKLVIVREITKFSVYVFFRFSNNFTAFQQLLAIEKNFVRYYKTLFYLQYVSVQF